MATKTLLIYQDTQSNKFWQIDVNENSFVVTYGKVGTTGAVKTKTFETAATCEKEAQKLIQSKLKKGYVIAQNDANVVKANKIDDAYFWALLETAKTKGEYADEQLEWLTNDLAKRSVKEIVMFDYLFKQHYYKSYTSDLWAATYIVMGGCSDDLFEEFRAWVLYQGRDVYEAAIQDPQSLLPYFELLEQQELVPHLEELLFVSLLAYEEKTGLDDNEYFAIYEQLSGDNYVEPELEFDWDENEEDLRRKFPLLWARYGETPLDYF